jgi:hypothetical protein
MPKLMSAPPSGPATVWVMLPGTSGTSEHAGNWRAHVGGDNRIRVFRLLKLFAFLGLIGAGVYYGTTVKLGDRTFYQHLRAIWETKETKDLRRGTKEKVGGLVDDATDRVVKGVSEHAPGKVLTRGDGTKDENAVPSQPPQEHVSAEDRKALRNIIGQGRLKPNE